MSTTTHAGVTLRPSPEIPVSRPRAVYSIDQILGTQSRKNGTNSLFIIEEISAWFLNKSKKKKNIQLLKMSVTCY